MNTEFYGVVEAQRRAREWFPLLRTPGQRIVFGVLLAFFSLDGTATPTATAVAGLAGMHPQSVRKSLKQLEEIGAIARVGDRANLNADGIARGSRIAIWTIPNCADRLAWESAQLRPEPIPPAPKRVSRRASGGSPLKVEKLNDDWTTGGTAEPYSPDRCPHHPVDADGYCTGCHSQVWEEGDPTGDFRRAMDNLTAAGIGFSVEESA
jgi:hypothetical protein